MITVAYLASKYYAPSVGERLKNTHKVIDMAVEVYEKSDHEIYPHVPHLTHWIEERMDYLGLPPRPNEFWYNFDNMILPRCDVLFKLSKDGESKGTDMEEQLAIKLKIPVVKSLEELLEWHERRKH